MKTPYRSQMMFAGVLLVFLGFALAGLAEEAGEDMITELKAETIAAYEKHYKTASDSASERLKSADKFLLLQADAKNDKKLRRGEIVILEQKNVIPVPDGLVHDWCGAMFIPAARAEQVIAVLKDYDNHKKIYAEIEDSKLLKEKGETYWYYQRLRKKKVLTVVLNTEHEATYTKVDDKRWYVASRSTKIAEVKNAGKKNETELPVGKDNGFLWRMDGAWFIEQADDGVHCELYSISLSRSIPKGLGWMIRPFVRSMPKETLESTLQATRLRVKGAK